MSKITKTAQKREAKKATRKLVVRNGRHVSWHPQTVEELVQCLFRQMIQNFEQYPERKSFEWHLGFIRSHPGGQVGTGLLRYAFGRCTVYAPGTPEHDTSKVERVRVSGPTARFSCLHKDFLEDYNKEARDLLRSKLIEAGIKIIPDPDNPKLY